MGFKQHDLASREIEALDNVQAAVTTDGVDPRWRSPAWRPANAAEARAYAAFKAREHLPEMIGILASLAREASRDSVRRAAASDLIALGCETDSDREEGSDSKPHAVVYVLNSPEELQAELHRRMGNGVTKQ